MVDDMDKSQFFYDLPKESIAQHPAEPRDSSRLMCLSRATGEIEEHIFRDILDLLKPGDVLVVNDSRVIPARLLGVKQGGGAKCEVLLLKDLGEDRWECLVKPGKRLRPGSRIGFLDGELVADVEEELEDGKRAVKFHYDHSSVFFDILDRAGVMPLPHYITAPLERKEQYQTVYAKYNGSAAAPTAGLHFTPELLQKIKEKGVTVATVTLHVGLGTFRPVKENNIKDHIMHSEWYTVSEETAEIVTKAKAEGRRVIAVGTTSCRTLESVAMKHGAIVPCAETTDIFIYPGYEFKCIDALITNFHLPESTLIMLVSAFAGYENTMNAYKKAVAEGYRFFSFGDAMFIS